MGGEWQTRSPSPVTVEYESKIPACQNMEMNQQKVRVLTHDLQHYKLELLLQRSQYQKYRVLSRSWEANYEPAG
jgi:hypothetical protein